MKLIIVADVVIIIFLYFSIFGDVIFLSAFNNVMYVTLALAFSHTGIFHRPEKLKINKSCRVKISTIFLFKLALNVCVIIFRGIFLLAINFWPYLSWCLLNCCCFFFNGNSLKSNEYVKILETMMWIHL